MIMKPNRVWTCLYHGYRVMVENYEVKTVLYVDDEVLDEKVSIIETANVLKGTLPDGTDVLAVVSLSEKNVFAISCDICFGVIAQAKRIRVGSDYHVHGTKVQNEPQPETRVTFEK